jgi:hypothetical protein
VTTETAVFQWLVTPDERTGIEQNFRKYEKQGYDGRKERSRNGEGFHQITSSS